MAKNLYPKLLLLLLISGWIISGCQGENWQPKQAPLMTKWAAEVRPENVHSEYPRPQMMRDDWINLNGLWQFSKAQKNDPPPFGKELAGKILVPFPIESALSGVMEKTKYAFYRKELDMPDDWQGKHILLHFGAVDFEANVYVNGQKAITHRGGYDPFTVDITPFLKKQGPQEIIVAVFDPTDDGVYARGKQVDKPGGIFYTSVTGIWQTVWLEAVNPTYIRSLEMAPDIDNKVLNLSFDITGQTDNTSLIVEAFDGSKKISQLIIPASQFPSPDSRLQIPNPRLWTPDNPHLYDLKIKLLKGDELIDEIKSYFAMRKISLGKDEQGRTRLMLNNKYLFQNGPLDQGYWPDGLYTAPTDEALRYDIEIAKKLGFNMIRKHAKVEPDRWYYWTDKLGMLVWQDMPQVNPADFEKKVTPQSKKQFESELQRMVQSLYNHPSIVMWVVFNEAWGQYDTERLTRWVKEMDPTRLVNNASGWTDKKVGDVIDWHVYPGPGSPQPEAKRAAVLGEFGGLGLPIEGHLWQKENWGYQNFKNRREYRDRYERLYDDIWALEKDPGLSAAVYTQITDVETEVNGLMTYDRQMVKLDFEDAQAFHHDRLVSVPRFHPPGGLFLDEMKVELTNRKGEAIRYTLDGSEPTAQSPLYGKSFVLTESATVKAKSFGPNGKSSGTAQSYFEKTACKAGIENSAGLKKGIAYTYFEGKWNGLPDFSQLTPVEQGVTRKIDLSKRKQDDFIGFVFEGFINVPADGIYTFYTESDDGSRLYIWDKMIVDNDGFHGMREERGQVALKAGFHPIKVTFFEGEIEEGLVVRYEGPGISKREIPATVLFHK